MTTLLSGLRLAQESLIDSCESKDVKFARDDLKPLEDLMYGEKLSEWMNGCAQQVSEKLEEKIRSSLRQQVTLSQESLSAVRPDRTGQQSKGQIGRAHV